MLKKIFLFSLLFIAVSSFVFSAKKKKAKEEDPAETLKTLEKYTEELSQTALENADLCYEMAMSEFAEKIIKMHFPFLSRLLNYMRLAKNMKSL